VNPAFSLLKLSGRSLSKAKDAAVFASSVMSELTQERDAVGTGPDEPIFPINAISHPRRVHGVEGGAVVHSGRQLSFYDDESEKISRLQGLNS
jgi:hypothetical protein